MSAAEKTPDQSRLVNAETWRRELDQHRAILETTAAGLCERYCDAMTLLETAVRRGGKLLLFGNGGSASDAQHIAAELIVRYKNDRRPIAAVALCTDTSTLTACANDLGYDTIFARQIEAIGRRGDAAVAISTSGRSANILRALEMARGMGIATLGMSGGSGGDMPGLCDVLLTVPSTVTARIQEMHITIAHMLCKGLEERLGLV